MWRGFFNGRLHGWDCGGISVLELLTPESLSKVCTVLHAILVTK